MDSVKEHTEETMEILVKLVLLFFLDCANTITNTTTNTKKRKSNDYRIYFDDMFFRFISWGLAYHGDLFRKNGRFECWKKLYPNRFLDALRRCIKLNEIPAKIFAYKDGEKYVKGIGFNLNVYDAREKTAMVIEKEITELEKIVDYVKDIEFSLNINNAWIKTSMVIENKITELRKIVDELEEIFCNDYCIDVDDKEMDDYINDTVDIEIEIEDKLYNLEDELS